MRNRVSHKFSFYPERYDGHYSCVGCGRCVVSCPVSLDIRHMVCAAVDGVEVEVPVAEAAPVVEAPKAEAPAPVVEAAPVEAPKAAEQKSAPKKSAPKGKSKKK
jgi:Fe-S oxidoreductase